MQTSSPQPDCVAANFTLIPLNGGGQVLVSWVANGSVAVLAWRAPANATDDAVSSSVDMTAASFLAGDLSNARVNNATMEPFQQALRGANSAAGLEGVSGRLLNTAQSRDSIICSCQLGGLVAMLHQMQCLAATQDFHFGMYMCMLPQHDIDCTWATANEALRHGPVKAITLQFFLADVIWGYCLAGYCQTVRWCNPKKDPVHRLGGWGFICYPCCCMGSHQLPSDPNPPDHIWSAGSKSSLEHHVYSKQLSSSVHPTYCSTAINS